MATRNKIMEMRKKILVFKWGRPTRCFCSDLKSGKSGDEELLSLCYILTIEGYAVSLLTKPKNYDNFHIGEVPYFIDYIDYHIEDWYLDKYDAVVVFLGPEDYDYNRLFIDNIRKYKGRVVAFTTDHRFMGQSLGWILGHLDVYTNSLQKPLNINCCTYIGSTFVSEAFEENYKRWGCRDFKYVFDRRNKQKPTLIMANQVTENVYRSRLRDIYTHVLSKPDEFFHIIGIWNISLKKSSSDNFEHLNWEMNFRDYMECLSKYSKIVIFQNSNDVQDLDEVMDYRNTFYPAKIFEARKLKLEWEVYNSSINEKSVKLFLKQKSVGQIMKSLLKD